MKRSRFLGLMASVPAVFFGKEFVRRRPPHEADPYSGLLQNNDMSPTPDVTTAASTYGSATTQVVWYDADDPASFTIGA